MRNCIIFALETNIIAVSKSRMIYCAEYIACIGIGANVDIFIRKICREETVWEPEAQVG
jgi:hypothetical protein